MGETKETKSKVKDVPTFIDVEALPEKAPKNPTPEEE